MEIRSHLCKMGMGKSPPCGFVGALLVGMAWSCYAQDANPAVAARAQSYFNICSYYASTSVLKDRCVAAYKTALKTNDPSRVPWEAVFEDEHVPESQLTPQTVPKLRQPVAQATQSGLTLRVLQEESVPYVRESDGGISSSCNIVGTANTSAYVNGYGNTAYGNATTTINQHMTCNSYDTTIRWPHVLNVMFAQGSNGISYIIACDRAFRWSKCVPLRAGEVFSARFTNKGIEVMGVDSKGKEKSLTYHILQSEAWR